jgi:hypothetical protein
MSKGILLAHKDTTRVSEAVVRSAPQPDFTDSWHPYSHASVLDAMQDAMASVGLEVKQRDYSVTKTLTRMFGVWTVGNATNAEMDLAVGIRNAVDKRFAVGICAGERVFVCDNLVFSSEFVMFRKHSGALSEEEIFVMAREAVKTILPQFETLRAWHEALKTVELTMAQATVLTVAAMHSGLLPPSNFPRFRDLYFKLEESKYDRTLHGWHGAMTETFRAYSLLTVQGRNALLNRFVDFEAPALLQEIGDGGGQWFEIEGIHRFARRAEERFGETQASKRKEASQDLRLRVRAGMKALALRGAVPVDER